MQVGDAIEKRKTIKKFIDKEIPWSDVAKILDAGNKAPLLANIQNLRIFVVKDPAKKKEIADASYEPATAHSASVLIIVCSDQEEMRRFFGIKGIEVYGYIHVGQAVQNMLLLAEEFGLGSCPIPPSDSDAIKSYLKIEGEIIPIMIIALGYPLPGSEALEIPRENLESITSFEEVGKKRDSSVWPLKRSLHRAREKIKKRIEHAKHQRKK